MSAESKTETVGLVGRFLNYVQQAVSFVPKEEQDTDLHTLRNNIEVIPCYKEFNEWGIMLSKMLESSHTHRTCVFKKADLTVAKGFSIGVGEAPRGDIITTNSQEGDQPQDQVVTAVKDWAEKMNAQNHSLSEIAKQAVINYEGFGFVCIELVRGQVPSLEGSGKFFYTYVHDFPKVLYKKPETKGGDPTAVYICGDWKNYQEQPKELSLTDWVKDKNGVERKALIVKAPAVLRDYYSIPPSIASLLYQQLQYHIPSHNLDDFFTDFMPKVFMQFYTSKNMTDTEWKKFYGDLEKTYTYQGGKRRKIFAQRTHHKDLETKITTLNDGNSDGDYTNLADKAKGVIFESHVFHPLLAGSHEVTGFGNSNYVKNVFDIYNEITIEPLQKILFGKILQPIMKMAAEWTEAPFKDHYLRPTKINPVNFIGEISPEKILTINEVRSLYGFDTIADFKEFTPVSSELGKLFEYHLKAGVVKVDELRESIGLDPIGGDEGNRYVTINTKPDEKNNNKSE